MAVGSGKSVGDYIGDGALRPAALDAYFASLSSLKGVGAKLVKPLSGLLADGQRTEAQIRDLLFHLPSAAVDRRLRTTIAAAPVGAIVTLIVRIEEHRKAPPGRSRVPHRVVVGDETGDMLLVYFANEHGWIERSMPVGAMRLVSGIVELFDGVKQIVHPSFVGDPARPESFAEIEPVYPLTAGVTLRLLQRLMRQALGAVKDLPEWLSSAPDALSFRQALQKIHQPSLPEDCARDSIAARRLALDSFFSSQLALALLRRHGQARTGQALIGDGRITERLLQALPFRLTGAQERAIAAIHEAMAKPQAMLHLLQGDVGSGKTAVAMLAMARAIEAGCQTALMAPTDILARQHFHTVGALFERIGLKAALLTGRDKASARSRILAGLAEGSIDAVIGTHALFQDEVRFVRLGLAIIDEQHRFGVQQRLALAAKGETIDLLLTTATPIPRTLVLAYYGDMEVSRLDEKPPGRLPIATRALPLTRLDEVIEGLARAVRSGARAYWVCPSISEEEAEGEQGVEHRAQALEVDFPGRVALLHGRLSAARREAALSAFARGDIDILVATTVVEVGVDVPEASIIVIENAEKFGLSQLHQLRGRVGRGQAASSCLLLYDPDLSETARARLHVIRESEDGFFIAEEDLRLRGPGEVLGTRQSGLPSLPLVIWEAHADLLPLARQEARDLVENDPDLRSPRGRAARLALYLFGQHEALRLIAAG